MKITKEYLEWLFHYDKVNGKLYWKNNPYPKKHWILGAEAGCIDNINKGGYRRTYVNHKRLLSHRIIYFLETNTWPKIIDHINGDTLDNRISNLRESTTNKNQSNRKQHRAGKLVGAHLRGDKSGYESSITVNKKRYRLGYFSSQIEAHLEYMKKARELGIL